MRVLCAVPPYVPSYFNAGHHLPVFQVGAYLRKQTGVDEVVCCDLAALNASWRDVATLLSQRFDAVLLLNDFDGVDGFARFVAYLQKLAPETKTATFGRASKQVPLFFARYGLDAIAHAGDYETSMATYVEHLLGSTAAAGVLLREEGGYRALDPLPSLDASRWVLPDIAEIPYAAYDRLYRNDLDKFCGIPDRRELVVPVARGCPIGCDFCDVPAMQGLRERRLDVDTVIAYIEDAFARGPFEYVSFYAPTFTLKRSWTVELCDRLAALDKVPTWKCVTTVRHLDGELVERMGAAGCVRISVGVETLTPAATESLPAQKRNQEDALARLLESCERAGIELNCFLILGLDGDRPEAVRTTIDWLIARGARVRPTVLTPYERMTAEMSEEEFAAFNRQTFVDGLVSPDQEAAYYRLLYANELDRPTRVFERVPRRLASAQLAT